MDLEEIQEKIKGDNSYDKIRIEILSKIANILNANVISYYSGYRAPKQGVDYSINDNDLVGLSATIANLDLNKPLYMILHTPGGYPTATEGIVKYLRACFKELYAIIPDMCMSAGTMFCCATDKIYMTCHSFLGPIDPQFMNISAYNIKNEFDTAKKEMTKNPNTAPYWNNILNKYTPAFYNVVCDAINLSDELASEWLNKYMFKNESNKTDKEKKIKSIIKRINSNNKSHSRHFNYEDCINIGFKIEYLEPNNYLAVLLSDLNLCYTLTFQGTNAVKIIESHIGKRMVFFK